MPLEKTLHGFGVDGPSSKPPARNGTLDHLFSVSYEELHRLAAAVKRRYCNGTVGPPAEDSKLESPTEMKVNSPL
jgi:hypothetical protein